MPQLTNKTAIVTGGASGIGLAIAQRFVAEGAIVEILDRNRDEMQAAVMQLGADAHATSCDITKH